MFLSTAHVPTMAQVLNILSQNWSPNPLIIFVVLLWILSNFSMSFSCYSSCCGIQKKKKKVNQLGLSVDGWLPCGSYIQHLHINW